MKYNNDYRVKRVETLSVLSVEAEDAHFLICMCEVTLLHLALHSLTSVTAHKKNSAISPAALANTIDGADEGLNNLPEL
jgi:hypothetical protein